MYGLTHVNTKGLRASYKVALRIAKAQKPCSVGEILVKDCIQDVCLEVLGETAAAKAAKVFLSNDTFARLTADLADNMEIQLVDQIKLAKYYSLQLDESTRHWKHGNFNGVCTFEEYEGKLKEEFIFLYRSSTENNWCKNIKDYY